MKQRLLPGIAGLMAAVSILTGCGWSLRSQYTEPSAPSLSATQEPTLPETSETEVPTTVPPPTRPSSESRAQEILDTMTLREKVGQLFIVQPDALEFDFIPEKLEDGSYGGVTELTDSMQENLLEYPVGGIVMFHKNILSPEQLTQFNTSLLHAGRIPMFLSVDEEGGTVARLANHKAFDLPRYRSAAAVGANADPEEAWEMGHTIGSYLKNCGFNMDFAPVADVDTNPDNPVIGARAFSSDAATAASLSRAAADGLHDAQIIPVFKHFPGHGDTAQDSHSDIAITHKTEEQLRSCEWLPFEQAGNQDCIMVGHIAVPEITGNLTPATMSHELVTQVLKEQLGFDGLIITDSLSMGAVTEQFTSAEAAQNALNAGCHILLMPEDFREAFDAVISSVSSGKIPAETLDNTVLRILTFKIESGILS